MMYRLDDTSLAARAAFARAEDRRLDPPGYFDPPEHSDHCGCDLCAAEEGGEDE